MIIEAEEIDYEFLFEQIIGKKFTCGDCRYLDFKRPSKYYRDLYSCKMLPELEQGENDKKCILFTLSDKTKAKIKTVLREFDEVGVDMHPTLELPNLFFHNNHICPFCDKKVKKKDEKGRCRLQSGKRYQWCHSDCKRSRGINIMGFLDFKPKLIL